MSNIPRNTRNPYDADFVAPEPRGGCLARAGMTVVEMVLWLAVMAALAIGMLWLLWTCSR